MTAETIEPAEPQRASGEKPLLVDNTPQRHPDVPAYTGLHPEPGDSDAVRAQIDQIRGEAGVNANLAHDSRQSGADHFANLHAEAAQLVALKGAAQVAETRKHPQ